MGADVAIIFGQTESTGGITYTPPSDSFERKSATVGFPYPHMDVKIINPATGEVVPMRGTRRILLPGFRGDGRLLQHAGEDCRDH